MTPCPAPSDPRSGFTLIELMIVVAIIAVVASIAIPNLLAAKLSANETSAIATLRSLGTAQVMVQGAVRIDMDNDAIGEFGTFMELSGRVGVRRGFLAGTPPSGDFAATGNPIRPPVISASLGNVEPAGYVTKGGYAFMVFLPDSSTPEARWVHEENTGTADAPVPALSPSGQTGGSTGRVGVDLSESLWCAYAIPMNRGQSGNRAFFTSQTGMLLQSANDVAKHQGNAAAMDGRSAFLGDGITSAVAVGTAGNDGDVWKVTN